MQWLRRSFITGFFVTVPLIVSVAALVWAFRFVDDFATPVATRVLGRDVPGRGRRWSWRLLVLAVGAVATNVIGKRVLQRGEGWLLRCRCSRRSTRRSSSSWRPFRPTTRPASSAWCWSRTRRGACCSGFLTREFTLDRGAAPKPFVAVYVPTNHLYLGDIMAFPGRACTTRICRSKTASGSS